MRGSPSSSPSSSTNSCSVNSTSRMWFPGWSPAGPWPFPGCAGPSGVPTSPGPCPTPPRPLPKRNCGSSIWGTGMLTKSFPWRPISSPLDMYLRKLRLICPRTICRKRLASCSMLRNIPTLLCVSVCGARPHLHTYSLTYSFPRRVPPREDARHVVEDIRRAHVAVAHVLDQPALHDLDLFLRLAVNHVGNQAGQFDRVLLILEEFQFERAAQAVVGVPAERLAVNRQRADVVHDLAAEVVLAALRDFDLLFNRAHQPLVGRLVLPGVRVAHLLLLRVRLDIVNVIRGQALDRGLVGGDGALDFVLDELVVLGACHGEQFPEALALVLAGDERVMLQAVVQLAHQQEGVDAGAALRSEEHTSELVLDVARRNADHAFLLGLGLQFHHAVLGEAGDRARLL